MASSEEQLLITAQRTPVGEENQLDDVSSTVLPNGHVGGESHQVPNTPFTPLVSRAELGASGTPAGINTPLGTKLAFSR